MNTAIPASIRAIQVSKDSAGKVAAQVVNLPSTELPAGEVTVRVAYSSLNFKDALAASAHPAVVKSLPIVPGIDLAGTVIESSCERFPLGTEVLVTGFDLGVGQWGGYCEYARVPADWVVKLPEGLSVRESMAYGTAGFTAAQSVAALIHHGVKPEGGEIVVTGAGGGVGSIAVGILSKLGYRVVAVSGKPAFHPVLEALGASEILDREAVNDNSDRPLLAARWAGGIDTVGGATLATLLRSTKPGGCVTACGLVGGVAISLTVYPFILRGVTLRGIDSVWAPMSQRLGIWPKLANQWRPDRFESLISEISLEELPDRIAQILAGQISGRVIVRL